MHQHVGCSSNVFCLMPRVEILSDWKSLTAALLDDAAVEARSDASTSNLLLLLKDAAHKAVGGQLIPSRQEARSDCRHCSRIYITCSLTYCRHTALQTRLKP